MKLADLAINKPVTITMVFLGIMLLGVISWSRLPQELFPAISYPQLTIVTTYENAAPEEIETLIGKIIEEAVGTVGSLKRISSTSKEGISLVTAEFNWGTNMDFASLAVREKIDLIKERLPLGSAEPIVMKFNPFELPIMTLSVTGEQRPSETLKLSRKFIKDELEKVPGVASCNITGGVEREIVIWLDQARLVASGIAINKVVDALKSSNLNYPAGTIEEHFYEYLIRTIGEFEVVSQIKDTIVGVEEPEKSKSEKDDVESPFLNKKEEKGRIIYLKDIAEVKDTFQEKTSISRYNGKDNISIGILKQAGANAIQTADKIKKRLEDIKRDLPKGIYVNIVYDQSLFIKKAIRDVTNAAAQGGFLAFLVLWFFLKRIKPALIVAFSIPISIMMSFILMYFSGITINMLSMGGLALGVGMLVDAGVVVIENISNHIQTGEELKEAARTGTNEVASPIWGSVMTTVVVFLPMIFVVGIAGQLFKEIAMTITYSLMASLFVSLALIPLFVTVGRRKGAGSTAVTGVDLELKIVKKMGELYSIFLPWVLKRKTIVVLLSLALFLLSMFLFTFVGKEFMPKVDQREFVMKINLPTGTKLDVTDSVVRKVERSLLKNIDVASAAVTIGSSKEKATGDVIETLGSHQANIMVNLKKGKEKGKLSTSDIIRNLKKELDRQDLEGAEIEYILQESVFKSALMGSAPIVIEIKCQDINFLKKLHEETFAGLLRIPGIYGVRTSLANPAPETKINIIKDKAALYNLSVGSISQAAHIALKGVTATKFKESGREIDVKVRLRPKDRKNLSDIRNILIYSPLGISVPLSQVAYISHGVGPSEIKRLDQQRVAMVTANITGRSLDKVTGDIDRMINRVMESHADIKRQALKQVEKDFSIQLAGENQEMKESFKSLQFALILSILLVYMIMASEFESFWQPFLIMFTIPLSLIGVAWILFLTHTPLSVVVILGVIMLGGIVVDNGIVLVDKINVLKKEGKDLITSVSQAGKNRLRPIMITSFTTVLGLLPLALGMGEGSELQAPMALTVMGGLTVATLLTLFVIPVFYTSAASWFERKTITVTPLIKKEEKPAVSDKKEIMVIDKEVKREESFLNKRQEQAIEYLKAEKRITRKDYARLYAVSIPTAARDLKELLDKGILKAGGPLGPGRWYELK